MTTETVTKGKGLCLSVQEAADEIGCSRSWLYSRVDQLNAKKMGKKTLVLRSELEKFITNLPTIAPAGKRYMSAEYSARAVGRLGKGNRKGTAGVR